jgi:hypothetical protein
MAIESGAGAARRRQHLGRILQLLEQAEAELECAELDRQEDLQVGPVLSSAKRLSEALLRRHLERELAGSQVPAGILRHPDPGRSLDP